MKTIILLLIIFTINAQSQWVQISTVSSAQLNAVKFIDVNTGMAAGNDGLWRTTNGGMNWGQYYGETYNAISFIDANNGLAAGNGGIIKKTTDGGYTWTPASNPANENLYSILWQNLSICYAAGQSGRIIKSVNGGSSWSILTNQFTEDLKGLYFNSGNGYVAGGTTHEIVAITINGGTSWSYVLNQGSTYLNAITSLPTNFQTSFAVGSNGTILRSTNFGTSWIPILGGGAQDNNSILFLDGLTGYIAGSGGKIIQTTNSGTNWTSQPTGTTDNLKSISFINQNTGWAVGQNGTVLRIGIPLTIQHGNSEIPLRFRMYQNYPDPFNPETTIKYDLPNEGWISLKVYDVYGRLIYSFNEFRKTGSYEFNFDGSNFASGVYFYRIEAGSFVESKKMVLLK